MGRYQTSGQEDRRGSGVNGRGIGRTSAAFLLGLVLVGAAGRRSGSQTLARPGWAGSGMTVAQWWRNAVLFQVFPDNGGTGQSTGSAAAGPAVLTRVSGEMDDLQVLGVDALLLRSVDVGGAGPTAEAAQGRLSKQFGTLEQFDELLAQASQRRIRVLVELPATLEGDALASAARFWLGRGVSGLFLGGSGTDAAPAEGGATKSAGDSGAKLTEVRSLLRGYVGDRVLVADTELATAGRGGPEMVLTTVGGFVAGGVADVAQVRQAVNQARAGGGERGSAISVAQIAPVAGAAVGDAARARLSVLLMVPGGVALRAGETGEGPEAQAGEAKREQDAKDQQALAAATSPAAVSNVKRAIARRAAEEPPPFAGDATFAWAQRMIGLHRGSPAMLRGQQTLLDFDGQGAIVSVWRGASGPVLCEVVNLREQPVELSLKQGFAGLGLRGVFLRPVARTDAGMGAMPLERVKLSGFGVFVGELGR